MTEPASNPQRLVELLESWAQIPKNQSVVALRTDASGSWWSRSVDAVIWLSELEEAIEHKRELRRVYDPIRDAVRSAVFSTRWQMDSTSQNVRPILNATQIAALRGLALAITPHADLIAKAPELVDLRDTLLRVRGEITSAANLSEEASQYLLVLVGGLEQALTEVEIVGVAHVARLADELAGSLTRLFVYRDGEQSQQAAGLVKVLVGKVGQFLNSPLVVAIAGGVAGSLGTSALGQITAG